MNLGHRTPKPLRYRPLALRSAHMVIARAVRDGDGRRRLGERNDYLNGSSVAGVIAQETRRPPVSPFTVLAGALPTLRRSSLA